jgi:hypothetical protein
MQLDSFDGSVFSPLQPTQFLERDRSNTLGNLQPSTPPLLAVSQEQQRSTNITDSSHRQLR